MKRLLVLACLMMATAHSLQAQERAQYDKLIATHAHANLVPEALVHRVIVRESKYNPGLVGRGGTIGLMQLKLATARGVGYTGDAKGLRDPETNLTYGVKYLAGAYRAAGGDQDRAMRYFASGYYHVAKQQRLERQKQAAGAPASAPPQQLAISVGSEGKPAEDTAESAAEGAKEAAKPKVAARKGKRTSRKLADAKAGVPRPPSTVPSGANDAKPR